MTTLIKCKDEVVSDMRRLVEHNNFAIWNLLIGPHGAVQFAFMAHQFDQRLEGLMGFFEGPDGHILQAMDVGYHSYEPNYPGQESMECQWLLGVNECYYDGSSLHACDVMSIWQAEAFSYDWLWNYLFDYYQKIFDRDR